MKKAWAIISIIILISMVASCKSDLHSKAENTDSLPLRTDNPTYLLDNTSPDTKPISNSGENFNENTSSVNQRDIISDVDDITLDDLPSEVYMDLDYTAGYVRLLCELPNDDLFLYGYDDPDDDLPFVILRHSDNLHVYNWQYRTPRLILPTMHYADFDEDGQKELAIILYIGSGTAYSVKMLRMVEFFSDNTAKDFYLPEDDYIGYLERNISYSIDNAQNVIIHTPNSTVNCGKYETGDCGLFLGIGPYGDIVSFDINNKVITGEFAVGLKYENWATNQYIGYAYVEIIYKNGCFEFGNVTFKKLDN